MIAVAGGFGQRKAVYRIDDHRYWRHPQSSSVDNLNLVISKFLNINRRLKLFNVIQLNWLHRLM